MTTIGLIAIAAGSLILSLIPATLGIPSYITPIVVITVGYALFQTANNTAVMAFRTPPLCPQENGQTVLPCAY
jgi:EamA domain-containing membrane protein RarD